MVWEARSKPRKSVSSGIHTPRSRLKNLGCASFFQPLPTSRCLDILMKYSFSCLIYYMKVHPFTWSLKNKFKALLAVSARVVHHFYKFVQYVNAWVLKDTFDVLHEAWCDGRRTVKTIKIDSRGYIFYECAAPLLNREQKFQFTRRNKSMKSLTSMSNRWVIDG